MPKFNNHEDYISAAPEQFRELLRHLHATLSQALPDADPVIKYDMPGFLIENKIIAAYAAFSHQCGLYVDSAAIAAYADEIAAFKLKASKTGVTFSPKRPITDDLIEKLATRSRKESGF